MIHFKKLIIKNFQSHVHTELDFHPGLNVFVGPSDSGKSAILRALRWVLFNSPRGTEYIRIGANLCEVALHLDDGTIIRRIRNQNSINRYQLEKIGEEPQIFEGFGSEVPLEIANAHQFRPLELDQKDIFLQVGNQLDGPFLLSESSGVKAKTIGLVSGAHLIDRALKKLNSDRIQLASKNKYLLEQRKNVEQKLQPFENLDILESALLQAEKRASDIKEKQSLLIQLKQLAYQYKLVTQEKRVQKDILERFPNIGEAEHISISLENKLLYLRQYRQLLIRYRLHVEEKTEQESIHNKTESIIQVEQIQQEIDTKMKIVNNYKKFQNEYSKIQLEKEKLKNVLQQTEKIDHGMNFVSAVEVKRNQLEALMKWKQIWENTCERKQKVEQYLKINEGFLANLQLHLPEVETKLSLLAKLQTYLVDLTDKRKRIAIGYQCIAEVNNTLQGLLKEYGALLTEHGECPICGSEINDHLIQHLLQELEGGSNYAAAGREDQANKNKN
ncbi:AAA family ATPase [Shimazuella sp. AN120528]|nr:AAA family ATPase [Shimazuella soli]MCH5586421.1 AAA family ATPase [Shimazuella soli]